VAQLTREQLTDLTREWADAVDSTRWSDTFIQRVLNAVYDDEWSNILNAAPYYTFGLRTANTDANGQVAFTALGSGTGDAAQTIYRVLSVTDGNYVFSETRFQDVPLATTSTYLPSYPRLYYVIAQSLQVLPVSVGQTLTIGTNWKPTEILDLASDSSTVNLPTGMEQVVAMVAAAKILNKGGAESTASRTLMQQADDDRATVLDDLRRRTINPTLMAYPDSNAIWAGN
jgi:hypothetical protein